MKAHPDIERAANQAPAGTLPGGRVGKYTDINAACDDFFRSRGMDGNYRARLAAAAERRLGRRKPPAGH